VSNIVSLSSRQEIFHICFCDVPPPLLMYLLFHPISVPVEIFFSFHFPDFWQFLFQGNTFPFPSSPSILKWEFIFVPPLPQVSSFFISPSLPGIPFKAYSQTSFPHLEFFRSNPPCLIGGKKDILFFFSPGSSPPFFFFPLLSLFCLSPI